MGGRVLVPEVMDSLPYEEARRNLRDIARLNERWGGHSTLRTLLKDALDAEAFSLLDVGAASGDMGACVRRWYADARVVSLDWIAHHLTECEGEKLVGDGFALPFRDGSFDYVFCSLFLHHFTDERVVELLREFGRVARRKVLVIDLERHPAPYYFLAWSGGVLGWDKVTVDDGKISVEAAFRTRELEELARRAGFAEVRAKTHRPAFRVTLEAKRC